MAVCPALAVSKRIGKDRFCDVIAGAASAQYCARDYAIQFTNLGENNGRARLQTGDAAWGVVRHESQLGFEATQRG